MIADDARRPLPVPRAARRTGFVRFHYGARGRRGNYSRHRDRRVGAARAASWASEVFAYFNNDWEGFAPRNADELRARLP